MQITELEVWKAAVELALKSYEITKKFPQDETMGLSYLIKRAAAGTPACVSSAASRKHGKESLLHLFSARDLLYELESHFYLANRLGFISEEELNELLELNVSSKRLLFGFIKYYKRNTGSEGHRRSRRPYNTPQNDSFDASDELENIGNNDDAEEDDGF